MADSRGEAARLREVHKYYPPVSERGVSLRELDDQTASRHNVGSNQQSVPDTALTAFLQLITWRLSMQRAMISLVDKDHQYFIAESTKTGSLENPTIFEEAGHQLWMGCTGTTTRDEALCTNTIIAKEIPGSYSSFVVTDLQNDPRFSQMPYVKGPPYFRFYAGTPLISQAGFRIGSLFVIDDHVHAPLDSTEIDFLGVMARNVMKYLDMQLESQQQNRHMTMSRGLAALVEGKSRIPSEWTHSSPSKTGTSHAHANAIDNGISNEAQSQHNPETKSGENARVDEQETEIYKGVFARASNLLRESLDVDYTLFIDTGTESLIGTGATGANVVAYSSNESSTIGNEDPKFERTFEQGFLKSFCRKYSLGKIWTYYEDGSFEYEEKAPLKLSQEGDSPIHSDSNIVESENRVLQNCFPHSRQILFAPLWENSSRNPEYFSACFAVSTREVPVFTTEIEVAFVRAFVNSVGVVCGHVAATFSEKQKSEFISSVSHELRSPLHGILASTELLYGTPLNPDQRDLCDTVDMCGQTLLDTLTQILDYSKVNNFLRSKQSSVDSIGGASQTRQFNLPNEISNLEAGSSLHVYSECDVASLCEEALDVVSMSFAKISKSSSPSSTPMTELGDVANSQTNFHHEPALLVEFTVPNEDWSFFCSPGAIRRIVMNLVGNSYKYTRTGSINFDLDLNQPGTMPEFAGSEHREDCVLVITVVDTGQGMSDDFMQKKLFVAFSQESALQPGSGLGLSLVQGIVKSLDGKIKIQSSLGQGTKVEVQLPLRRSRTHTARAEFSAAPEQGSDASLSRLDHKTYKIFSPRTLPDAQQRSLQYYLQKWWNLREVEVLEPCDFTFLHLRDLAQFLDTEDIVKRSRHAIVMSDVKFLRSEKPVDSSVLESVEPMLLPFGPKKLFKTLRSCLDRETASSKSTSESSRRTVHNTTNEESSTKDTNDPDIAPPSNLGSTQKQAALSAILKSLPIRTGPTHNGSQLSSLNTSGRPCVLCVDDNSINLKVLQSFNKKLGFDNVETAEDGLQAYHSVERREEGFDIIFMDLTMPICDGFESTRRIRKLEEHRRKGFGRTGKVNRSVIVALTGLASDEDQRKAFAAGVDHFVTKPLRFKDLKAMLIEWNIPGAPGEILTDGSATLNDTVRTQS